MKYILLQFKSPISNIVFETLLPKDISHVLISKGKIKLSLHQEVCGFVAGAVNEHGKKAVGLDWQKHNFARASRFFDHFVVVLARLRR